MLLQDYLLSSNEALPLKIFVLMPLETGTFFFPGQDEVTLKNPPRGGSKEKSMAFSLGGVYGDGYKSGSLEELQKHLTCEWPNPYIKVDVHCN